MNNCYVLSYGMDNLKHMGTDAWMIQKQVNYSYHSVLDEFTKNFFISVCTGHEKSTFIKG